MSASRMPTSCPCAASAAAMFTVSDDLPTPPLPDAIASTRVRGESWIPRSGAPPRSCVVSAARSSGVITSNCSRTERTPGSDPTCSATWSSKLERSGQPATVRAIVTETSGPSKSTARTMFSSVTGRRSSGSITRPSPARTSSRVATLRGYRADQERRAGDRARADPDPNLAARPVVRGPSRPHTGAGEAGHPPPRAGARGRPGGRCGQARLQDAAPGGALPRARPRLVEGRGPDLPEVQVPDRVLPSGLPVEVRADAHALQGAHDRRRRAAVPLVHLHPRGSEQGVAPVRGGAGERDVRPAHRHLGILESPRRGRAPDGGTA